jgi:uncharacterized membrane protein YcaP (DUF421 family)
MLISTIFATPVLALDFAPIGTNWQHVVQTVFGGDQPIAQIGLTQIAARAALIYLIGLFVVRIGKGRMIGRATALDVILGFMLGSLLSRGITGDASLTGTIVASLVLVAVHWLLTLAAVQWHWFGSMFKGHAYQIVRDGEVLPSAIRRAHISEHDLITSLRLAGVENLSQVREAWKERNGEVSVIRKSRPRVIEVPVKAGVQTVRIEIA